MFLIILHAPRYHILKCFIVSNQCVRACLLTGSNTFLEGEDSACMLASVDIVAYPVTTHASKVIIVHHICVVGLTGACACLGM